MHIYNTLTKKIEKFIPNNDKVVTMYTCGPTVYNYAHIGNLRTYITEDILEKTLNYIGYNVKRVMNITDIGHLSSDADEGEDKMVKSAKKQNKTVLDIAKYYTDCFLRDMDTLNIKIPETIIPATTCIDEYIKTIETLIEKGYAYLSEGNVYFDTSKLDNYYALTNHQKEDLITGAREDVEEDTNKKNKTDFVLWFTKSKFDDQELKWDSPWGIGYPGWHIECSCISMKHLGETLDIHCGGVDNIFPHHTNEIAQSESYLGHKWCNYWIHGEFLNDKSGKMSKSKGEFLTLSLLNEKGYNPLAYRYMCLNSHYRKQLVFSYEVLESSENEYKKLLKRISNLNKEGSINNDLFDKYNNEFKETLKNDLNTASSLTLLYKLLKDNEVNDITKLELIKNFDKVLSLDLVQEKNIDNDLINYIDEKINERNQAKKDKDYQKADSIREELLSKGIIIKDTREGTIYELN